MALQFSQIKKIAWKGDAKLMYCCSSKEQAQTEQRKTFWKRQNWIIESKKIRFEEESVN